MATKSVKMNVAVNTIRTVSGMLFPMITFPYTSRVLGPEGTGKLDFANSLVGYFAMFAAIGIPMYGIREIARVRHDPDKLTATARELFLMHLVSSFVSLLAFLAMIQFNGKLQDERLLFYVVSSTIVLTCMSLDWLYQGLEEYLYITIRSIATTLVCVAGLFLFVKNSDDYVVNAGIAVFASVGSSLFNLHHARGILLRKTKALLDFRRHIRPLSLVYALSFVTSIYLNLDTVMLGFLSSSASVGYYASSMKLTKMLLSVVTSFGGVMLPRLSFYVANGQQAEFDRMLRKSFSFVFLMCLPIIAGMMLLAPDLLVVVAGERYLPAAACAFVTAPVILFIGLSNILGIQILYPLGKDKLVVASVAVGAVLSFTLNLILIPRHAHFGAAVATLISEAGVVIVQIFLVAKVYRISWPYSSIAKCGAATAAMSAIVLGVCHYTQVPWIRLAISIPAGAIVYGSLILAFKESFALELAAIAKTKLLRGNR